MQQWKRIGIVAACALAGAACTSDAPSAPPADDALRQRIIGMGFRPDMIVDKGSYYVVEGDIEFDKTALRASADTAPAERRGRKVPDVYMQWSSNNTVGSSVVTNIRVNVSGAEASWQTAIRDAMTEWNALTPGSTIHFVEGTPAQISFTMEALGGDCDHLPATIARADFPSNAQPGGLIRINPNVTCLTASQKKFNMAHELGHTIGFRHTNWVTNDCAPQTCSNPGSLGANQIRDTPATDAASVMNGSSGGTSWAGFSQSDKVAGFNLYPPAGPSAFEMNPSGGHPQIGWNANPLVQSYNIVYVEYGQDCNGDPDIPCTPFSNETFVGTTTGTTFVDMSRQFTGSAPFVGGADCSLSNGSAVHAIYQIGAVYPAGSTLPAFSTPAAARVLSPANSGYCQ